MTRTAAPLVRVERIDDGRLACVLLDAGRGNVIGTRVIAELSAALASLARDGELRAILLDHAGPDFSFGASVEEHAPDKVAGMLQALHALACDLASFPIPTLAAVRGRCLGGGLELVALCDIVFAACDAKFAQPELNLGVFAPIGSLALPRLMGAQRAAEFVLSGRTLDADEARHAGLVFALADDPTAAASAWIDEHLGSKSTSSLRHGVQALRGPWAARFVEELARLETQYVHELMATHDAVEGIRAFLDKRSPRWSNS